MQHFCCIPNRLERDNICSKHTFRNHSEENILALSRELTSTLNNFQVFSEFSIGDKFKFVDSLIQKACFKYCSNKTKTIVSPKPSKPWITALLHRCMIRKHQLHKDLLNNPLLQDKCKRYRNTLRNSNNTAKKIFYHNLFETASDIKTTCRASIAYSIRTAQTPN